MLISSSRSDINDTRIFGFRTLGLALTIGQQLGSLEITALLGKGGMGEVYRARDLKLKREVAIKILPDEFSRDADRVSRFQREAEVLASLSHPNIAGIYDLQHSGHTQFLVLELVEGETLADRIKRGPVPVDETLQIGKNISEALEAAHEKGIVHRDLKPANIKLTRDGKVKVLDFGLAKAIDNAPTGTMLSNSPTLLSTATTGVILGTAAYMAPEQAKGKSVDKRADIWAFGVVLYEMLTGRMMFSGETASETMAAVMTKEPDWNTLPANVPARVRDLLRRCLVKGPRNRLQAIGDARIVIEEAQSGAGVEGEIAQPARRRSKLLVGIAAVLLLTTIFFAVLRFVHFKQPELPELRVQVNTLPTADPTSFAISPDGRRLVFRASNEGKSQLWLRSLDTLAAQPLTGTDGAGYPFWSPDSASVGFFADAKLKRIDIAGGSPRVLANAAAGRGGAWNQEGTIVFAPSVYGSLFKVYATGGDPAAVTQLQTGETGHKFPHFLPDGRHFIYFAQGGPAQGVYVRSLDGASSKRLANADAGAVVSPSGFLLFLRQTTLLAQAFDFKRQELSSNPFPVAEDVAFDAGTNAAGFSAAAGIVAYWTGTARQLTWLDRSGKIVGMVGAPDMASLTDVELSPDEKRVAVYRAADGNPDVWLIDVTRGVPTRFTYDPANDLRPLWSPDGNRIVFNSNRKGVYNLYWKLSSGTAVDELLLESDQNKLPTDWSSAARSLLFLSVDPQTGFDLWVLPFSGDKKPFPFLKTPFEESEGQFSPDGRWIAYQSNESGRFEIYVQPFPGPGAKFQISANGGAQPRWNKNGKEIFYVSLDSKMMAAPVKLSPDGHLLEMGTPAALFPVHIAGGALQGINRQQYAVSSDGQRFLVNLAANEGAASPVTLIYNWKPKP
jgi:serine/threonine protein kinase/Tol biopolymer transport system component